MEVLDAADVRAATPWPELIDAIAETLCDPRATAPDRGIHPLRHEGRAEGSFLVMPAWRTGDVVGVKAVTYMPANAGGPHPTIHAGYLLFDGRTGRLEATLDGDELTARRTAATSALASRHLARPGVLRILVVGTGRVALELARAHACGRELEALEVWGRNPDGARRVTETLLAEGFPATATDELAAAVSRADLISCATGATEPLIAGRRLPPGVHLDLVGSFSPDMREADDEAVRRASLFVDTLAGARLSGDLAGPLASGVIGENDVLADLADLTTGRHPGRTSPDEITLFKSAGFALADLAAARLVRRRRRGEESG